MPVGISFGFNITHKYTFEMNNIINYTLISTKLSDLAIQQSKMLD